MRGVNSIRYRSRRDLLRGIAAVTLIMWSVLVHAHKSSDAYLQLSGGAGTTTTLRVDVALRDLDAALDLDSDGDGKLMWSEVRAAWPIIENYIHTNIALRDCDLTPYAHLLERRVDGVYAALILQSACNPAMPPSINYGVMRDVDPTHRGILRVEWAKQPSTLQVLVPQPMDIAADSTAATITMPSAERIIPTWQFVREGVLHILTGYDHVLFLICLLLPSVVYRSAAGWQPVARLKHALLPVLGIVTAFTVAHSITLALAATHTIALSPAFIEPAIAVTIALAALDNLWPIFRGRRIAVAFFFGLIHGFGFAGVLAELNLPAAEFAWALFQFNLGIEIGQLFIVSAVTTLLFALRARRIYPWIFIRAGSIIAIVVASAWFVERVANISLLAAL